MTLPRIFVAVTVVLFSLIGIGAYVKKTKDSRLLNQQTSVAQQQQATAFFEGAPIEINLKDLNLKAPVQKQTEDIVAEDRNSVASVAQLDSAQARKEPAFAVQNPNDPLPNENRIEQLFQKGSPLPIVETIRYKSRVAWKPGRAAWLIDYAFHYKTPLDFVARSINGRPSYVVPPVTEGVEFNVLRQDKNFYFYLLVDLSRNKLWLYYIDPSQEKRCLLKTYRVGLGRLASEKISGSLTPIGKFKLGSRIAVFKPKMMGLHRNKRVELIRVFGTRWIPFDREVEGCSEPAKGFGLHGTPWYFDEARKTLIADDSSIGKYESDGCIRLAQPDIEEIYAIITTKDSVIEIVRDFHQAKLPYQE